MNSDLKIVDSKTQKNAELEKDKSNKTDSKQIDTLPEIEETYLGGSYTSATIKKIRQCPEQISKLFKEGQYPYTDKIGRPTYETEKKKL